MNLLATVRLRSWSVLGVVALACAPLMAQPTIDRAEALKAAAPTSPVRSVLVQKLVQADADGRERLVDAAVVKPGDKLQYELTYNNAGSTVINGLLATLPIPAGTFYLPETAMPTPSTVSLDGVQFSKPPLKRLVERNGKTVEETVPPQEYKALRWSIGDLAGKGSVTVKARVEVNPTR